MEYLAFDLGGSGGKTFLGRYDGHTLHIEETHRFENDPIEVDGALYWDIFKIYQELKTGIRATARSAHGKLESLGIDSFCNDFALVDKRGEMLCPVRAYRDERTIRYENEIYAQMDKQSLYMRTGNQIAPFNTLMQLAAMRACGQGFLLDNAYKLLFVPDLLIRFLTGAFVSEYTVSSVSQMYSFEQHGFDPEILDAFRIRRDLFAPIAESGSVAGQLKPQLADELGTNTFSVVCVCEHDTASAFLGATEPGAVIISSGTWSLVGIENETPVITESAFRNNFANEGGYPGHHRILRNVMGSWLLQQVRAYYRAKGNALSHSEMIESAEAAPAFGWLIDVDDPVFFTPGNMPEKIRSKCREAYGSEPKTIGELTRCVCESLAMKYRWVIDQLEILTGVQHEKINIVGGGCKNKLLCQMAADATNMPVVSGPVEATAAGNFIVQMIAAGEISTIEEGRAVLRQSADLRVHNPENTGVWDAEYKKFKVLYGL